MIKKRVKHLLLINLLQVLTSFYSFSQEPAMRHFTVNDGLASSAVYTILSDSQGFLWFCTEAGVSRYDGRQFTNFTISDGLSGNEMLRDYQDAEGRIWFLGFNGTLSYYYKGKFFNPSNDSVLKKAKIKSSFLYFFEDKRHRLWFTADNEYLIIDGEKVSKIDVVKNNISSGGLFMNSAGGVYLLSAVRPHLDPLHLIIGDTFRSINVKYTPLYRSGFCYLKGDAVLFWAREGLILQKDTVQKLLMPLGKEFNPEYANTIYIDKSDKLWVTTIGSGAIC